MNDAALFETLLDGLALGPTRPDLADRADGPGGPTSLGAVKDLVRSGVMTSYQAEQVRLGRGRGLILGPYVLLEPLGEGGMGLVFKARHRTMRRLAAIKVIRAGWGRHPDALRRFRREIEAAARLSHPNVVIAHDADEHDGTLYFAMEHVEGIDLAALLRRRARCRSPRRAPTPARPPRASSTSTNRAWSTATSSSRTSSWPIAGVSSRSSTWAWPARTRRSTAPGPARSPAAGSSSAAPTTSRRSRRSTRGAPTSGRTSTAWAARSTTSSPAALPSPTARRWRRSSSTARRRRPPSPPCASASPRGWRRSSPG